MTVMSVANFERFFRAAAELDVDKNDLERYSDFINKKTHDLLFRGKDSAMANRRVSIEPQDLPITKGLQESIRAFETINEQIELKPVLESLNELPPLDLIYSSETEAKLPEIVGGISFGLARAFRIIDPDLKNPQTRHWEQAFRIFDQLL